jgi:hypothetical protein
LEDPGQREYRRDVHDISMGELEQDDSEQRTRRLELMGLNESDQKEGSELLVAMWLMEEELEFASPEYEKCELYAECVD